MTGLPSTRADWKLDNSFWRSTGKKLKVPFKFFCHCEKNLHWYLFQNLKNFTKWENLCRPPSSRSGAIDSWVLCPEGSQRYRVPGRGGEEEQSRAQANSPHIPGGVATVSHLRAETAVAAIDEFPDQIVQSGRDVTQQTTEMMIRGLFLFFIRDDVQFLFRLPAKKRATSSLANIVGNVLLRLSNP